MKKHDKMMQPNSKKPHYMGKEVRKCKMRMLFGMA